MAPAGRLVEEVWRGSRRRGGKTLRSYVSRLRAVLAPEAALVARGGGYVVDVDPDLVDAVRFERLVGAAQAALGGGEAAAAESRFREALGLWRGPALAGVGEVEPLAREAARLEELRLAAVEGRIEADIAVGRHAEVIGELEGLVGEYPLRERLWRLLVLALYRAERQADALAAYRRARELLAAELGLEPGEELRRLEQAVLRQQVPSAPPRARHNLPAPLTSFLGRDQDLARVGAAARASAAGHADRHRRDRQDPAGRRGRGAAGGPVPGRGVAGRAGRVADPGLVAAQVMGALGVRQAGDMPVMEALRYRLRSADLLLVLDNCEHLLDACARARRCAAARRAGAAGAGDQPRAAGHPGEVVYPVRPLDLPPDKPMRGRRAGSGGALFLDRGSAARGGPGGGVAPVAVAGADLPRAGWAATGDRAGRRAAGHVVSGGDRGDLLTGSGSWPTGGPPRTRGIRRCGQRSTGAITC